MDQNLTVSDEVHDRLQRAARQRGLTVEQLLAQVAEGLEPADMAGGEGPCDEELLVSCTRALLVGGVPPLAADWNDIESTLAHSDAPFATVEDAMSALRRRP